MNNTLAAVDLLTVVLTEYERRRQAWQRMHNGAATHTDRQRIRTQANADLLLWQDVVHYFDPGYHPDDSRPMARSARITFDRMRESETASNDQILGLYALTRHLEQHALHRHRTLDLPAERKAA